MGKTSKILCAFVTGAAVGTALGILFAPEKGEKTRKKLQDEGVKMMENLEENLRKGKEKLDQLRQDIERKIHETKQAKS